jgi:predicted anti-sigma-YlaC factor YlaD
MIKHPRETALEIFVLGSGTLNDADRDSIELHLDRCAGCRALADRMVEFYGDLRNELGSFNDTIPAKAHLSIRPRRTS